MQQMRARRAIELDGPVDGRAPLRRAAGAAFDSLHAELIQRIERSGGTSSLPPATLTIPEGPAE